MATTGTQLAATDGERRATLLKSIGERMKAVYEEAARAQESLLAAAEALVTPEGGETGNGALVDHVDKMLKKPEEQRRLNSPVLCEQFLIDAAFAIRENNYQAARQYMADYRNCVRP